ncbi:TniQ family protein [Streptomyces mirabilis]
MKSFDSWLFNDSPRYCPQCMAGDGSTAQQKYGGPWKKIWQLPIAFLCPDHLTFLRHGCPRDHETDRLTPLFAGARHADLHLAECRLPDNEIKHEPGFTRAPCRARLDVLPSSGPVPSPRLRQAAVPLTGSSGPRHDSRGSRTAVRGSASRRRFGLRVLAHGTGPPDAGSDRRGCRTCPRGQRPQPLLAPAQPDGL